ncbi:hypothetical protein GMORB2_6817 [Geosmithia morbida]|uniref:S-adenosylmethionine-dependent methyltransferase-like protein n=1 Tax=Geosmithia morbida TaxID=1094350 RepID=A0A9P4YVG2_9HYPO|nr:uncharacterized protein GMORB2_6817 [Geosmithia morbida]KAF4123267.1 hypothetical protein GMORB2_6817 [Geosmithia morbida]
MPTFPRLGKHSDRSHNNLTEDSSSSPPPGQGLSSTLSQFRLPSRNSSETSFNDQRTQPPTSAAATYHQQQHPAPSAGDGASIGGGGGGGARIASQQQLYNNNSSSDVGDSQSFFAGRRHSEFDTVDPSVQRSQSQSQTKSHRYSAYAGIPQHSSLQNQQQQQAHDSSPNPQAQPVMAPSTQGLTRGGKGSLRDQPGGSGAGAQTPRFEQSSSLDLGRQSPQPDRDSTEGEKAFNELLAKYKNVKRLYFDRKAVIEGLNGQVEQLQNAVANQRITHSRTALDDNEYSARSNRLNGAIMNLAFNIRKDWKSLPPWLASKVSADALKTGKQEMTAVGRATISRWLTEELFDKCFHPGLDEELSSQLKMIELSIRGNAYTMHSQEEFDALTTKVVHWRMATLDGLQSKLSPDLVDANKQALMKRTTTNLTNYLYKFLNDPPPAGVDGSTSMIAELAVSIAGNLPLESRDVAINYPLPGDIVRPDIMEVEKTELPPIDDGDSDEDSDEDSDGKAAAPKELKVRFAAFMAWEVRGRQVLVKAPVWTM